jgi:hypothetical protein
LKIEHGKVRFKKGRVTPLTIPVSRRNRLKFAGVL